MAFIYTVSHLPRTQVIGSGLGGHGGHHGGGGLTGALGGRPIGGTGQLPPGGIIQGRGAYPVSPGWIPIKTNGAADFGAYQRDPAKESLAQSWRTLRHAANTQNSFVPPLAFEPTIHTEANKKPVSGGGKPDVGFRQVSVTRQRVEENRG